MSQDCDDDGDDNCCGLSYDSIYDFGDGTYHCDGFGYGDSNEIDYDDKWSDGYANANGYGNGYGMDDGYLDGYGYGESDD